MHKVPGTFWGYEESLQYGKALDTISVNRENSISDGDDIEGGSNSSVNSTSNISSVVDLNMSSIDNSDTKTE